MQVDPLNFVVFSFIHLRVSVQLFLIFWWQKVFSLSMELPK